MRAADEDRMELARQPDIVHIAAAAGQETRVLHASNRLTEAEFSHASSLLDADWCRTGCGN
jgi:hypothetical protein